MICEKKKGQLIVLSGPSGVGKTTVANIIAKKTKRMIQLYEV